MDIKTRIEKLMDLKNLSAGEFATRTGIQRSSVSHIFSGRNKPSLEIVERILNSFPEISADWLLTGKGEVFKKTMAPAPDIIKQTTPKETEKKLPADEVKKQESADHKTEKDSEKVLILHSDGTYTEYSRR